jgi:hypothetical protein
MQGFERELVFSEAELAQELVRSWVAEVLAGGG